MFAYCTKREAAIATSIVDSALSHGWTVSLNDSYDGSECWAVKRSTDRAAIISAMNTTDGDFLLFRDTEGKRIGFVSLIYGNDPNGSELISDHSAEGPVAELCESFYCV